MNYYYQAFKWNFLRFIPNKTPLIIKLTKNKKNTSSYASNLIAISMLDNKVFNTLLMNLALFIVTLALVLIDDTCLLLNHSLIVNLVTSILSSFFLILQFDAWKIRNPINILKLIYIICSAIIFNYSLITYLFLIIFENIEAFRFVNGGEEYDQ